MEQRETGRRLMEARTALVRDLPFFGFLALKMQLACAPCGTACTDGSRLIFDPSFACRLDDPELQFVMLHELLHCVLNHCTRCKSRLSGPFNIACDIVVNSIIFELWGVEDMEVNGEVPMHLTPDGEEGRLFSAEEVYSMLLGQGGALDDSNGIGTLDRHDIWRGISDGTHVENQWKVWTAKAVKECGSSLLQGSSALRRLTEQFTCRAKVDWRQLLHDFLQVSEYDYGFQPPDRRFCDGGLILPAYQTSGEALYADHIWICVDVSGSVWDEELSEVFAEILDAMRQVNLEGKISFFDTDLTEPVSFSGEEDIKKCSPPGGGGTSFDVIFQYLEQAEDLPKAILIFTDGCAPWPEEKEALGIPVFWLISQGGRTDVPWGTVAEMT